MIQAYKKYWENYFRFHGESSRFSYWSPTLTNALITFLGYWLIAYLIRLVVSIFAAKVENIVAYWTALSILLGVVFLYSVFCLLTVIPSLAVSYRRYRDTGLPAWAFAIELVGLAVGLTIYYYQSRIYESNVMMPIWLIPILLVCILADVLIKILPTGTFTKL